MSMTAEYRVFVKAKFGPGGRKCRCCQPALGAKECARFARRKRRQETRVMRLDPFEIDSGWDAIRREVEATQ